MKQNLMFILNEENNILSMNQNAKKWIAKDVDYFGRNFYEFLLTEKRLAWDEEHQQVRDEGLHYHVIKEPFIGKGDYNQIIRLEQLRSSEQQMDYRHIINTLPDAIVIIQDGEIEMANQAALNFIDNLEGDSLDVLLKDNSSLAKQRMDEVMRRKTTGSPIDYTVYLKDGKQMVAEFTPSYIEYDGRPAILSIGRDITIKKEDLKDAARMQRMLLSKKIPNMENFLFKQIYVPAKTVSGDFYFYETINDNQIIGILGDVSGKGVTAAMKISAFEVLFKEAVDNTSSLEHLVLRINSKMGRFFGDLYVAAIVFMLDTAANQLTIVSAGINQFSMVDRGGDLVHHILRGPFLGMLDTPDFDKAVFQLEDFSRLLLYSDGFEQSVMTDESNLEMMAHPNIYQVEATIQSYLETMSVSVDGLEDDTTMLMIENNFKGKHRAYQFSGLTDYTPLIDPIVEAIAKPEMSYTVKLIMIELMTNAYRHGNQRDPELPIVLRYVFYNGSLFIEVMDMGLVYKRLNIKKSIEDEHLLDENGRGLFLISQFAKNITVNGNTVIVELSVEEET